MLTLSGNLLDIVPGENKDRTTGEITKSFTAEILHKSRGKSVVDSVKLDIEVLPQWQKAIGSEISVEVRMYAMKTSDGGVNSGFSLADKKCLPTIQRPIPAVVKAA